MGRYIHSSYWFLWYAFSVAISLVVVFVSIKTMTMAIPMLVFSPSLNCRLMPAHMALFLVVVYMYSWQWVVASYIKLLRPFSTSLLRSVTVPRYWYWCAAFAFGLYFGVCFYLNWWMKILAVFTFVYFLVKVSAYESIKVFQERIEETM